MSYTVLARRYRSSTFDEVVGQDHIAQTLKRAIESGRIAHAYLFCGTRGVGKTSMARILAKALNCLKSDGPTAKPCLKCDVCQAIARGDDLDVLEIDAASNTQVDKVRELIESAQFRPARGRHKIFIIDEVHMLSRASFNALLKTLEEPPEHVKFILATTEAEKILPTILSRCQRFDFRNIPTREIASHLQGVCRDEKVKVDEDALLMIAKAGAGSMRDAISLLERVLSLGEKHVTVQAIEQLLGMPRSQLIFDLAQAIGEGRVKDTLEQADRIVNQGLSVDSLLGWLSDHFRNLLVLRTCGAQSGLVEVPGLASGDLQKQAGRFDPTILAQDVTIIEELRRQLRSTQAGRALLDATLCRLAMAEQFSSVSQLMERLGGATSASAAQKKNDVTRSDLGAVAGGPLPVPAPEPIHDPKSEISDSRAQIPDLKSSAPVDASDASAVWQALLSELSRKGGAALGGTLAMARFEGIRENQAVIRFPPAGETYVRQWQRNGKRDAIAGALSTVVGRPVGVQLEVDAEAAAAPQRDHAAPAAPVPLGRPTPQQLDELQRDPIISALTHDLNATIVRVSDD